jgi:hypothetical protein
MIIINTVNSTRFSLNGIQYFKNYISEVAGSAITIYNAYDRKDVKVDFVNFAEIELNGTVYGNVGDLQSALLPVIYTRASLGGGGGGTPTLQEVLDNNHDLVDGNNFQGTGAGDGNTGTEVNAFGTDAGKNNTALQVNAFGGGAGEENAGEDVNAFGVYAGFQNEGANQNAFGYQAGAQNTANNQNAFGYEAGTENIGANQNALGLEAGQSNTGDNQNALGANSGGGNTGENQNAFGSKAGQNNTATNQNALGFEAGFENTATNQNALGNRAGYLNTANNQNALGESAGRNNSGRSQNAFGSGAGQDNTGDDVNAFGDRAGDGNSFSNVNLFGAGAQADEDGQTVFSKDSAIMARFSTVELTETRKYTLPDADDTLALLSDIPPAITIDANPTDGSSNAVSSNGVFDALALKCNKPLVDTVSSSALTGVTTEGILKSYLIPANTLTSSEILNFANDLYKTGTAGTCTSRLYTNTTASLSGALLLATNTSTTGNRKIPLRRQLVFKGGNVEVIVATQSLPDDNLNSSSVATIVTFNTTVNNYLITTAQNANAGDSTIQNNLKLHY